MSTTSTSTPAPDDKIWYEAICHCKKVHYRTKLPAKLRVNRCSCSICTKLGYLLVYPYKRDTEWISGYDTLVNYRMGPKKQDHKHCPSCGAAVGIDSMEDIWRFNMRLFKDFHKLDVEIGDSDGVGFNEEFNDPELM